MMMSFTPSPLMSPALETDLPLESTGSIPLITNPFVPSSDDNSSAAGNGSPAYDCAEPAIKKIAAGDQQIIVRVLIGCLSWFGRGVLSVPEPLGSTQPRYPTRAPTGP